MELKTAAHSSLRWHSSDLFLSYVRILSLLPAWFALCGRTGRQADKHPGPAARRGCGAFLRGVWRSGILGEKGVTHGVENEAG